MKRLSLDELARLQAANPLGTSLRTTGLATRVAARTRALRARGSSPPATFARTSSDEAPTVAFRPVSGSRTLNRPTYFTWGRVLKLAAAVIVVIAMARTADAHPLDLGTVRIAQTPTAVTATLDLHVTAAAALLHVGALDAAAVTTRASDLAAATLERAPLLAGTVPCQWGAVRAALVDRTVRITLDATCPAGPRTWTFPVVRDPALSPRFLLLVREATAATDRLASIESPSKVLALAAAPTVASPVAPRHHRRLALALVVLVGALFGAYTLRELTARR